MWINVTNLCVGDVDDIFAGDEPRRAGNFMVQPVSLHLVEIKFGKTQGWMVKIHSDAGYDPKVHFTDADKALDLYNLLVKLMVNNPDYHEIDVLAHGAI